jgi:hypothetical protein
MSKPSLLHTIKSALWALIGIQSKANMKTDLSSDSAINYIIAGVLITALFVIMLISVVSLVI